MWWPRRASWTNELVISNGSVSYSPASLVPYLPFFMAWIFIHLWVTWLFSNKAFSWFRFVWKQTLRQGFKCKEFIWEAIPVNTSRRAGKWNREEKGAKQQGVSPSQLPPCASGVQAHRGAWGKEVRHTSEPLHPGDKAAAESVHQFPAVIGGVLLPRMLCPWPSSRLCVSRAALQDRERLWAAMQMLAARSLVCVHRRERGEGMWSRCWHGKTGEAQVMDSDQGLRGQCQKDRTEVAGKQRLSLIWGYWITLAAELISA